MSNTLNYISWIVATTVTVAILIAGFCNNYYLIFNETVGVFGAAGYLLAIFLHLQATNMRRGKESDADSTETPKGFIPL